MDLKALDDALLKDVNGGRTLPENWEELAKPYIPFLLKQYGKLTYAQACAKLREFFSDEDDLKILEEYIKQYYPDSQE
ncbi:MAG: hypothetical protein J6S49_08670 [Erysipelotrichaceae bacterium]|nr:hypothetical protein [Erysipelotrichaceae bacterium]MBP5279704.1 hypothetical protein [Erysipelotrichaceae bacterium]